MDDCNWVKMEHNKFYNAKGDEVVVPRCERCNALKICVYGVEKSYWICAEHGCETK